MAVVASAVTVEVATVAAVEMKAAVIAPALAARWRQFEYEAESEEKKNCLLENYCHHRHRHYHYPDRHGCDH